MGVVYEAVEDGIGNGRIADLLAPVVHRELTGDKGGGMAMPLFDHLQEVSSFRVGHRSQPKVVNHQEMSFGEFSDGFAVASVSSGYEEKGTDLFINDRQAVSSQILLTVDGSVTTPLALPTVDQNERRSYAAWILETIVAGEWEPIRPSLQWGQRTNSPS
jgi:hypothetical protein